MWFRERSSQAPWLCRSAHGQVALKLTSLFPSALLSQSPGLGWGQGPLYGVTCLGFPGQCAAAPPSRPSFPYSRHTVNNRPFHQLCDCCRDPYRQAREALDQTGYSLDLCPGLLARKHSQASPGSTAGAGWSWAAALFSSYPPSAEVSPALSLLRCINKLNLVLLHSPCLLQISTTKKSCQRG